MEHAVVIGAGISGIATAIRLSAQGTSVLVIEKSGAPGGKIAEFKEKGFRFDMGPSLFTMPSYVEELYKLSGEKAGDHFNYRQLDLVCRYFYEDGTVLDAFGDTEKLKEEFSSKTGEPQENIDRFLRKSKELYELTAEVFIHRSLHDAGNYLSRPYLRALAGLHRLDPFRTMHQANAGSFVDKRMVQLFDRYATYNGSDPYQAPATLNVISHLEHHIGAYFPEKGMYDIVRSLVALAERRGVNFLYNEEVKRLKVSHGKVSGVETGKGLYPADMVVSSVDVHSFYEKILPAKKELKKIEKHQRSSSALIFYWGVSGLHPRLDVHNILFSGDYRKEFDYLFNKKLITDDPTVYIFISSKMVPGDAPPGSENWFVMVNAPEVDGQDWGRLIREAREHILRKIGRMLGVDVSDKIVVERILDPAGIEARTSSHRGSLYGISSNSMLSAFRRHPNRSKEFKGLYFTGGSVHPGGGIPLCLSSARIAARMIRKDRKKDR